MIDGGEQFDVARAGGERQGLAYEMGIDFRGVVIALSGDYEIPRENLMELEDQITGMRVLDSAEPVIAHARLTYLASEEIDIGFNPVERELVLSGPESMFGNGSALAFIGQYVSECLRASESGTLLVHAAAVKSPEHETSHLILGEKGAGKTTVTLHLCHDHGYHLIGNDQVFLGVAPDETLVTDGGNAWFNVRETAIVADPRLSRLLSIEPSSQPPWNNKVRVDPGSIGIETTVDRLPLESIFHIRIDHTQSEIYVAPWIGVQKNLILHERFGRHVSAQATPFQDDRGNYLGSLPLINPSRTLKARDELVRLAIKTGITEVFAPDSQSVTDFIASQTQK